MTTRVGPPASNGAKSPLSSVSPVQRNKKNMQVAVVEPSGLPELRSSDKDIDKTRPLPTSLQSDFLPDDILMAIVQPPPPYEKLGPPSRYRNINTSSMLARKAPDNVWNNSKRREKFKYLTDRPPCVCGAGNDISFLYDVPPKKDEKPIRPSSKDPSAVRIMEDDDDDEDNEKKQPKTLSLPDTLIPEEYHVVKNKGVLGLEYHPETFATHPEDHEKHLVMFPSMKPVSRYEVQQLKKTMQKMLNETGLFQSDKFDGPTQMHNLLELIKVEQNIYNLIFHELIRQVSIECVDRGELLAELRERYTSLLNKVPTQIKGLHEEVLAQRALDRRLTEELMRFKSTISALTDELTDVKEHDRIVTQQAKQAQADLKAALADSQKNASLLTEYHGLYELQRKRLEKQVGVLSEEKEVWSAAAYSLALKVTEESNLNTAKRLHVCEKAWVKLANHFTILLSDKDTDTLTYLQKYVDCFRDLIDEFNRNLCNQEAKMKEEILKIKGGVKAWHNYFRKYILSKDGHLLKPLDRERTGSLYGDIKAWEELVTLLGEEFGGDNFLNGEEALNQIKKQVELWTECALKIFNRHRSEEGNNHPDHDYMLKMNQEVDTLCKQYHIRLTGENGVAAELIHMSNSLETWNQRLASVVNGSNPLPDQEWLRFYQLLDDWMQILDDTLNCVGSTTKELEKGNTSHKSIDVVEMMRTTQNWLSSTTNGIDSEDSKMVETVTSLHTEMVKWMVQVLLRLAPDREGHSKEAKQAVLVGSAPIAVIQSNAKSLFHTLSTFTRYVSNCCRDFVNEDMQSAQERQEEHADKELKDLQRMSKECEDWVMTAQVLLCELTGEPIPDHISLPPTAAQQELPDETNAAADQLKLEIEQKGADQADTATGTPAGEASPVEGGTATPVEGGTATPVEGGTATPVEGGTASPSLPVSPAPSPAPTSSHRKADDYTIQAIGNDANAHPHLLKDKAAIAAGQGDSSNNDMVPPQTPNTKRAYEALAALGDVQEQLVITEERAQIAEDRALELEEQLKEAMEKIRALERSDATSEASSSKINDVSNASLALSPPKSEEKIDAASTSENQDAEKSKEARPKSRFLSPTPEVKVQDVSSKQDLDKGHKGIKKAHSKSKVSSKSKEKVDDDDKEKKISRSSSRTSSKSKKK